MDSLLPERPHRGVSNLQVSGQLCNQGSDLGAHCFSDSNITIIGLVIVDFAIAMTITIINYQVQS